MPYIGRSNDKISNVEILTNLVFDGSSSYSITKNSVPFTPNSAQSLLISIDGVVQATNFTVNGSTIDFGVAIPSTSTCNFFLHYGTGVMTVPSDGSVTESKIGSNAVTSAKMFSTFKNGITMTDQFRLTADIVNTDGDITSNLERVDDTNFGKIGTGMTESSGIFSFPSTGLYLAQAIMESLSETDAVVLQMNVTSNNGTNYNNEGTITQGDGDSHNTNFASGSKIIFFNVTDTSTHKVKFTVVSAASSTVRGNTNINETCFTFIRLGDSV